MVLMCGAGGCYGGDGSYSALFLHVPCGLEDGA